MLGLVKRWKLETEDRLKYSPLVRGLVSRYRRWSTPEANGDQQALAWSIHKLCAAARFAGSDEAVQAIQRQIRDRLAVLRPKLVDWSAFMEHPAPPHLPRGVLLKPWLGPREKGVLFVSFEKEWVRLWQHCDLKEFSDRYSLVIAPSSSPHNLVNYIFAAAYPGKLFTLISNASDNIVLPRVASNLVVLPLYASQWVLPELFEPRPFAERDVDLIMIANFAKVKRHHALFAALKKMPAQTRVLLIGQDQDGRTAQTIRQEASLYGVSERLTIQSNLNYPGVAVALSRARASVVLSQREGSCVVVAESLFAGTPAALLRGAEIGSRAFLNPQTGVFLEEKNLAANLMDLIHGADAFAPRQWAEDNISCHHSSRILNEILREHSLKEGQDWTQDIAPLCWRPDPRLVHGQDEVRLESERQEFKTRFGIEVGISKAADECG